MKNPNLWLDSSGKIEEFLDAQPGIKKNGAHEWHLGGGMIRVFPIKRMEANGNGPPRALIVLYGEADTCSMQPNFMDRLLKFLGRIK